MPIPPQALDLNEDYHANRLVYICNMCVASYQNGLQDFVMHLKEGSWINFTKFPAGYSKHEYAKCPVHQSEHVANRISSMEQSIGRLEQSIKYLVTLQRNDNK